MKPKVSDIFPDEYAEFYKDYIQSVSSEYSLTEELEISIHRLIKFVREIPMDKIGYIYAPDKWTIRDILQHLIDAERVFAYRALRFARNDATELPGFDENNFSVAANANRRNIQELLSEIAAVRQSTLALFQSFTEDELKRKGIASKRQMTVRALGFVIIGHQNHHIKVFQERYL